MPYSIRKVKSGYAVFNKDTGKRMSKQPKSKASALKHLKALQINVMNKESFLNTYKRLINENQDFGIFPSDVEILKRSNISMTMARKIIYDAILAVVVDRVSYFLKQPENKKSISELLIESTEYVIFHNWEWVEAKICRIISVVRLNQILIDYFNANRHKEIFSPARVLEYRKLKLKYSEDKLLKVMELTDI